MADIQEASDFVRFLVGSLVEDQDAIQIDPQTEGRNTTLELTLSPSDLPTFTADDFKLADMLHAAVDAYSYKHRLRTELFIVGADEDGEEDDGAKAAAPA
ncbi:MAG TPA: hypothetical protein DIU15_07885 [Deltaproteobacteria bacterium]|nr:hypothetical protein [Deltaproteobacteria bacterium]